MGLEQIVDFQEIAGTSLELLELPPAVDAGVALTAIAAILATTYAFAKILEVGAAVPAIAPQTPQIFCKFLSTTCH